MKSKRDDFAAYIEDAINRSPKTQIQIAADIGYDNSNIITMFKKGSTRVPLEKVIMLARSLDLNPTDVIDRWFEAYMPAARSEIRLYFNSLSSQSERSWITALKGMFGSVPYFKESWSAPIQELVLNETSEVA